MSSELTYLGFDTFADALTFKKFLMREGYEKTQISAYSEEASPFRVFFKPKEDK